MISRYASENIAMKGELDAELQRGKTGRRGRILKRDRPTEYGEVRDFVLQICGTDSIDWDRLLETNLTAQKIERDFTAAIQSGIHSSYFRGRRFPLSAPEPASSEFWAAPKGKQKAGRYNEHGERVLYLCRDIQTVAAECQQTAESPKLLIQKFVLIFPENNVVALKLDLEKTCPFLHYVLLDSEYIPEETGEFPNVKNPYRATHFLAHLAKLDGVSAIEYPSARGNIQSNPNAINLVLMGDAVAEAEAMTDGKPFSA
jgi:RES domain-containing protein